MPFYHVRVRPSQRDRLTGRAEERAVEGIDQLEELRRPGSTPCPSVARGCGERVERIAEVGDVSSTPGSYRSRPWVGKIQYVAQGYATGAAEGLTTADLPDRATGALVPGRLGFEMREQIRLWILLAALHVCSAHGPVAPFHKVLGYEKMLDEEGREMHSSWEHDRCARCIRAHRRRRHALAVLRPAAGSQPSHGYGPAKEIKKKLHDALELGALPRRLRERRSLRPVFADLETPLDEALTALDRWLVARTRQYVGEATQALEDQLTYRLIESFEAFVDDVSNWYIRRSRRRFWDGDEARSVLWHALVQGIRGIAPVMPFLAEHLWREPRHRGL